VQVTIAIPAQVSAITAMLEGLTALNFMILSALRHPPKLYTSGVRYRAEQPGRERWLRVDEVLKLGYGDCEDLATWRAAELRLFLGVPARAGAYRSGKKRFHSIVIYPDGTIEDPSRRLGMRRKPNG
jgi:hypothetical protein